MRRPTHIVGFVLLASLGIGQSLAQADTVYAWGNNSIGELGDGTLINRLAPIPVPGMTPNVSTVAMGALHSLAIKNGQVYAWGRNDFGAVGDGTQVNRSSPVLIAPGLLTNVTSIAGGSVHSLAVNNGAVYAWGWNGAGGLGDGTVTTRFAPVAVSVLNTGVTAVAAGEYYSLAIRAGALYGWGQNFSNELGDGTSSDHSIPVANPVLTTGVTAITAGSGYSGGGTPNSIHSMAIQSGALFVWGQNAFGQLGDGTTSVRSLPTPITSLSANVTSIAVGERHSLAVQNGFVFAWGDNNHGQLGDGTINPSLIPEQVSGLSNIVQVAATLDTSYALSADGSIWSWGANPAGQLGAGDLVERHTPFHILAPAGMRFTSLASEVGFHMIATAAPVPEPAALAMLALSTVSLIIRRRRNAH